MAHKAGNAEMIFWILAGLGLFAFFFTTRKVDATVTVPIDEIIVKQGIPEHVTQTAPPGSGTPLG